MTDKGSRETFAERLVLLGEVRSTKQDHDQIYRPIKKVQKNTHNFAPGTASDPIRLGSEQVPDTEKVYKTKPKQMQKNVSFLVR